MILDVVGCEHRHQLGYRVVIQRHGLHIFVVDLLKASLLIVDRLLIYLFIYFISFNVIQPMWLCRQILTHKIADMSERRKQAKKQKKTKKHT
jgi:hypothetical protein